MIFKNITDAMGITGKRLKPDSGKDWSGRKLIDPKELTTEELAAWEKILEIEDEYDNIIDISYKDRRKVIQLKKILK